MPSRARATYPGARWVGPDNVRKFGIRFTGQVWPGDVLTLTGRVDRVEDTREGRVAHLSLAVVRQTGDAVLSATAVAAVV